MTIVGFCIFLNFVCVWVVLANHRQKLRQTAHGVELLIKRVIIEDRPKEMSNDNK